MYVAGVLDGLFFAKFSDAPPLCRAKLTNREAAEIVTRFLKENPAAHSAAASAAVRTALAGPLGCDKAPADSPDPHELENEQGEAG
jgi:hypothetical protein